MADQQQPVAQPPLSPSNGITSLEPRPSDLSTEAVADVTVSNTSETAQGIAASVVADRDGSATNPASMEPTSCAETTSPSFRSCGLALSPKTGTAGADSADCESVLSPISPVESEQQPRLLVSQSISLAAVPQSIPNTANPSTLADEDRSLPATGPADSTLPPSHVTSTAQVTNAVPPSSSSDANQASVQDVSKLDTAAALPADHPSHTSIINPPVSTSTPALADCSVDVDQGITKLSTPAAEPAVHPSHSSPTPTTSTSLPLSAHGTSDCGSEPRARSPQPIQESSTGPAHSALSTNHVTEPFDSAQYPAQTTSSLSPPLSPVNKSPSPQTTTQLHGHQNGVPLVPPAHVNKNGLLSANGDASNAMKVVQEQVIQDSSSTPQSPLPSHTAQPTSQIASGSAIAPQASMAASAAPPVSTVMSNDSQLEWLVPGSIGSRLSREQHRFAISVLKNLKKSKSAGPFLQPVDIVKLQIPDYPTIIKHPMDLATVEHRLGKALKPSYYKSADEFISDVHLIFNNCYTYNGETSIISRMANDLRTQFDSQMKKLPSEELAHTFSSRSPSLAKPKSHSVSTLNSQAGTAAGLKRKISSPVAGSSGGSALLSAGQKRRSTSPQQGRKKSTKTSAYATPAGAVYQDDATSTAAVFGRRNSMATEPNRNKGATLLTDGEPIGKNKRKATSGQLMMIPNTKEELKFCKEVLREVNKKAYEKFVWPFYEPVDPVKLGVPEYLTIIKKPMDLSTIKQKLDRGDYQSGAAFAADFRLMLNNCFTFNPVGTPVYNFGKQLEGLFECKWHARPADTIAAPVPVPAQVTVASNSVQPTGDLNELQKIQWEMQRLQERLEQETAKNEILSAGIAPLAAGPPHKKQATSKAASAAKNLANINTTSPASLSTLPMSAARGSKSNGTKAKGAGGRKKSIPGSAAALPGSAKRPIAQQLQERAQNHSQLYQQQQAQQAALSSNAAMFAPNAREPEYFEKIDYEQKKDLATMIQNAVEPMQSEAINLIRNAHPDLVTPDGEEIELDIDALDDRTLYRLYQLVCSDPAAPQAVAPVPVKKRKTPGPKPKPKANGQSSGPKKKGLPRKGIDERQEAERIKLLENKLDSFNTSPAATQPPDTFPPQPSAEVAKSAPPPAGPVEYASSSSESESESDDESD